MPPLCSRCGKNPPTVHLTQCIAGSISSKVTKHVDLCEQCAKETRVTHLGHIRGVSVRAAMPEDEAHFFVIMCLRTASSKNKVAGHVRADAILAVAPAVAKALFKEKAREKLKSLGIESSEALGKLIYQLIEKGRLSRTDGDRIEDFQVRSPLDDFLGN